MNIKKVKIDTIFPSEYNPRKDLQPGDAEYEKLKNSIEVFGNVVPIIVNKRNNKIVGGHQRYKILQDLGYTEIECVYVDLSDQGEKTLNIALNKISGEWDQEKLKNLLEEFREYDIDETLSGFSEEEIDQLIGSHEMTEEFIEEVTEGTQSKESTHNIICPKCHYVGHKDDFRTDDNNGK